MKKITILFLILFFSNSFAGDVRISAFGSYRDLLGVMEEYWENGFGGGISGELLYPRNIRNELGLSVGYFENQPHMKRTMFWIQAFGTLGYEFKIKDRIAFTPYLGFIINTVFFNELGNFSIAHNQNKGAIDETEMGVLLGLKVSAYITPKNTIYIAGDYHRVFSDPAQPTLLYRLGFARTFLWRFLDY